MRTLNSSLLENLLNIANEAGEHLKHFYARSLEVKLKPDHTPVTEADLFLSRFVSEKLQILTPDVPILSEESCKIPLAKRAFWQEYWIIDPLDGTQQFINHTDQFSVVIGLMQKNRPVLGVIHAPLLNKTYFAMQNDGAYLQENGKLTRLNSKKTAQNDRLLITIGTADHPLIRQAASPYTVEFIQYGSSSLKSGLVAEGKADCYLRLGDTGEWDTAVAELLLKEAGGAVYDLQFQPLSYNQRESFVNPHFIMVGDRTRNWPEIFHFN